jgi:hypothetical protein
MDAQASVSLVENDLPRLVHVARLCAFEKVEVVARERRPLVAIAALAAEARRSRQDPEFLGHRLILDGVLTFIKAARAPNP